MKNGNMLRTGMIALVAGFALMFSQCDSTEQAFPDNDAVVTLRGNGVNAMDMCACYTANFPLEDLSQAERDALMYMREEEKLARDVYLELEDAWNAAIFTNIANSEQRHMDAVKCLIDKYGLTDVVGTNPEGVFINTDLQALYNTLVADGAASLTDALNVGATIEDLDIYDLMNLLDNPDIDNGDVREVFNNLLRGSRNHLRAFTANLENLDATYTPEYITEDLYEAIITGDHEKGTGTCSFCNGNGGGGNGQGNGNGPGNGSGQGNCNGTGIGNPNGPGNGTGICTNNNPQGVRRIGYIRADRDN